MRAKTWSEAGLGGGRIVLAWLRLMRAHASLASASAVAVASILLDRSPFSSPALLSALAVALITGAGKTRMIITITRLTGSTSPGALSRRARCLCAPPYTLHGCCLPAA